MTGVLIWTRENLAALYAAIAFYKSVRQLSICDGELGAVKEEHWETVVDYVQSLTGFLSSAAQVKRRVTYDVQSRAKG